MFQNQTKLKNCIKIFSIDEFSEFEGLWENSCIAECYFNETGINTPSGVNVSHFKANPYLSTEDIEKCVEGGECEGYFSCTIDLSPNYLSQPPSWGLAANKHLLTAPVIHNLEAELINDDSTICRLNSQTLAICLEERIYSNCPKDHHANCLPIQTVLAECKTKHFPLTSWLGVERLSIAN